MTDFDPFSKNDEKQETDPVADFLDREQQQLAELNGRSYAACISYRCIIWRKFLRFDGLRSNIKRCMAKPREVVWIT